MCLLSEQYCYFVVIPLFAAFIWFSSLLAMLLTWFISGRPQLTSFRVPVAFISDIGATSLKPLFIVACCITGPGFFISLIIEHLLRHKGRLPPDLYTHERVLGLLAIVGAFIAMLCLGLLSGFDTKRHPTLHNIFLLVFIVAMTLSVISTVIEFRWLALDYAETETMKRAYIAKAVVGSTLVVLALVFVGSLFWAPGVGVVIEWLIGFGFTFYLLTFAYDLSMVKGGESRKRMVDISYSMAFAD